jgi:hypothetical protein
MVSWDGEFVLMFGFAISSGTIDLHMSQLKMDKCQLAILSCGEVLTTTRARVCYHPVAARLRHSMGSPSAGANASIGAGFSISFLQHKTRLLADCFVQQMI